LARLEKSGRVRRIGRGLYIVVDRVRETPAIAIASGLYADDPHYVTTDAALVFHGLLDQPVRRIVVVQAHRRTPIDIGPAVVWPVKLEVDRVIAADSYETTTDGFRVRVASREQAIVDALAEPAWMEHGDLLAEVLGALSEEELERAVALARGRTKAAAQRLGYLLEDAGRAIPDALADFRPLRAVRLHPGLKRKGAYSTRWRVYG
jgi:predicted transcriptional regulator of viral defense system